jgi:transposase
MDGYLHGSTDSFSGRIDVIEGRGRRLRSEEERARIAAESMMPGAKVADVARRHGVTR